MVEPRHKIIGFIAAVVALGVFFGGMKMCASCEDAKREREIRDDVRAQCVPAGRSEDERDVANCIDVGTAKCRDRDSSARSACAADLAHARGLR